MDGFARRLVLARERKGLTREGLSELTGKPTRLLGKYERAESRPPLETAVMMARALDTSLDYLCGLKVDKTELDHLPYLNIDKTGPNIRRLANEAGITVKEIQETLGLASKNLVYKWMNGHGFPSIDNLIALAYVLGVTVDDIIITD